MERLLALDGDAPAAQAKRARIEFRLDSGWGSEQLINWLLTRGYQVTGKFKSTSRVRKLVAPIAAWEPTASPGREVAPVPAPVGLVRPEFKEERERLSSLAQEAVGQIGTTNRVDAGTLQQMAADVEAVVAVVGLQVACPASADPFLFSF